MHSQILDQFLPIKRIRTYDQRFMGLLPISYVFKKLSSYTFTFFLTCSVLGTILLPLPIRHFFFLCQILPTLQHRFQKPYPQSKTFLNVRTVPSSADFCSNAVLITIPSSSKHFFSLFDVLSNVPITSGMTLMILCSIFFRFPSLVPGISQFFPSLFC